MGTVRPGSPKSGGDGCGAACRGPRRLTLGWSCGIPRMGPAWPATMGRLGILGVLAVVILALLVAR